MNSIKFDNNLIEEFKKLKNSKRLYDDIRRLSNVYDLPSLLQEYFQTQFNSNNNNNNNNSNSNINTSNASNTMAMTFSNNLMNHSIFHNLPKIIIQHIEEIGWNHFLGISEDFHTLQLVIQDEKNRNHLVDFTFTENFPLVAPIISISLPFVININWKAHFRLKNIIHTIHEYLQNYSSYFDVS